MDEMWPIAILPKQHCSPCRPSVLCIEREVDTGRSRRLAKVATADVRRIMERAMELQLPREGVGLEAIGWLARAAKGESVQAFQLRRQRFERGANKTPINHFAFREWHDPLASVHERPRPAERRKARPKIAMVRLEESTAGQDAIHKGCQRTTLGRQASNRRLLKPKKGTIMQAIQVPACAS